MGRYVLALDEIDRTQLARAGGKAANLGELSRIDGVRVPAGFCVTTDAFERIVAPAPAVAELTGRLTRFEPDDREAIAAITGELRATVESIAISSELAAEIIAAHAKLGERDAYAVRSSATAEDSPTASFAGQQDSYLNVVGRDAIISHVSRCWASLFTERAVTYRMRNGIDHREARMAVIVQRMLAPRASGILFTAHPLSGNRKVASIEAVLGLGEALVSGLVTPDVYEVRDGEVVTARPAGARPALAHAQAVRLAALGRRIEAHFGRPQDIEWCLVDDDFHVVQSRPITTLFPIPKRDGSEPRVYISVGHQQMMTDAIRPLGIALWKLTAARPMFEAGARLFVDVSPELASPTRRAALLGMIGKSDPLIGGALRTIVERGFIPLRTDETPAAPPSGATPSPPIATDPAIVADLIARGEASIATLKRDIRDKAGAELIDFILADIQELRRLLFDPRSHQAIMAGMEAAWWLNDHLREWLGEKNAADVLTQSVARNVTSEMGLALLDVADVIRPHAEVVSFLENVGGDDFLGELPRLPGGGESRDAIRAFLEKYGMRCAGEIDITRPRWAERPSTLLPVILGNVRSFAPGESSRRFEQGRRAAASKEQELITRLRALPDGERKAEETKRMIDRVRTFAGYREYPKYGMVSRYFVYKRALLGEAERLVRERVIRDAGDIFYLTIDELRDVVRTRRADEALVGERREEFRSFQSLTPPRVLTSEGEVVTGSYGRDGLPAGALVGLAVSAGTVEGRARVVRDIADATLEAGDILVTAYTDPSWTPLFVAIAGLVAEVGGLMTHGAVIAREYGLPAVVGVENATHLIRDGQRIRVHGTEGYVELLD
ncbi:MAG TPA: rifamycin-inactivating phosphotransferase [Gemmatimonadaceae bacterium]